MPNSGADCACNFTAVISDRQFCTEALTAGYIGINVNFNESEHSPLCVCVCYCVIVIKNVVECHYIYVIYDAPGAGMQASRGLNNPRQDDIEL